MIATEAARLTGLDFPKHGSKVADRAGALSL
jgi:hypothetical protein